MNKIKEILEKADVCRISFAANNIPYMVTMNFGYKVAKNPVLYFHCGVKGKKLDFMKKNNLVCFTLDIDRKLILGKKACGCGMKFGSIVGWGRLKEVKSVNEKRLALDLIMKHYGFKGPKQYVPEVFQRTKILKLTTTKISVREKI